MDHDDEPLVVDKQQDVNWIFFNFPLLRVLTAGNLRQTVLMAVLRDTLCFFAPSFLSTNLCQSFKSFIS